MINIDPIKLIKQLEELQEKISREETLDVFDSALTLGAAIAVIEALLEERKNRND